MRQVRHVGPGAGMSVLEGVPIPAPGDTEILIGIEAAGVTLPTVRKTIEGSGPVTLGGEIAGTVLAIGTEVTGFRRGDTVTGLCFGDSYAEAALLDVSMASPVPAGADAVDAVALVRSGLVARGALDSARLLPGDSVLVTAAASGVGHLAIQLAKASGADHVIGAVSHRSKRDFVRGLGADEVRTYNELRGVSVDVVLDGVGGDLLTPALAALNPGGRLVVYSSGGGIISAFDLLVDAKSAVGFQLGYIARTDPQRYTEWRDGLWTLFFDRAVTPAVTKFSLEDAPLAHECVLSRRNLGKVVIIPGQSASDPRSR